VSVSRNPAFRDMIESVARALVSTDHRVGGSYIRTPLMYPSGSTVVIRVEEGDQRFFISDVGLGHQEAEA
jgi:hypothetical protein